MVFTDVIVEVMRCRRSAVAALFLLCVQTSVFAATLDDYQQRVKGAKARSDSLIQRLDDHIYQSESISEIKRAIPPAEMIEALQGSVETDNRWLGEVLARLENTWVDTERVAILTEVSERLGAISESLDQVRSAREAELTKDQDKQKLAEILRREEYQKPADNEPSLFQKWWNAFVEWLARAFPRPSLPDGVTSGVGSLQYGLQILIYVLVIGLVGFLIYKIAPLLFRRFRWETPIDKKHRVILGERINADETASDLFSEAEKLAREGNLRAAIRKGYIALLCDLGDRKMIRLAQHKTNRDYLRDLKNNETLFNNVNGLTRNFERNWYGLRTADQNDWEEFRAHYHRTITSAKARP